MSAVFSPRRLALVLALLAAPLLPVRTQAEGEATDLLTLERAVEIAEIESRRLGAADARVGAAEAGMREAKAFRRPDLGLAGGYQRTTNPVFVFGNLLRQENFGEANFAVDSLNQPDPLDNWSAAVVLEQPLWAGGKIRGGIESAEHRHDAVRAERERTRQQVVRQVTEAYTAAVLAKLQKNVAEEARDTARANVELIRDLFETGLVVESDLLLARVRAAEVEEMLVEATSNIGISRAALNLAMGRDVQTPMTLPDDLALVDTPAGDLDDLVRRARESRPDLEAMRLMQAAAESGVGVARAGKRPQVGLGASWETNAEELFGNDGDNWSLAVGVEWSLFDGGKRRARIDRARQEVREIGEQTALLEAAIALEVHRALAALETGRQRFELSRQSVELAKRSLQIVEDRYKEGLVTLPELLGAEAALTEARLREVAARRGVLLARTGLDLATGDL